MRVEDLFPPRAALGVAVLLAVALVGKAIGAEVGGRPGGSRTGGATGARSRAERERLPPGRGGDGGACRRRVRHHRLHGRLGRLGGVVAPGGPGRPLCRGSLAGHGGGATAPPLRESARCQRGAPAGSGPPAHARVTELDRGGRVGRAGVARGDGSDRAHGGRERGGRAPSRRGGGSRRRGGDRSVRRRSVPAGGGPIDEARVEAVRLGYEAIAVGVAERPAPGHLLSPVVVDLLLESPVPVVVARRAELGGRQGGSPSAAFSRVLVPVSGDPESRAAQELAFGLAGRLGSEIVLVHVVPVGTARAPGSGRRAGWRPQRLTTPRRWPGRSARARYVCSGRGTRAAGNSSALPVRSPPTWLSSAPRRGAPAPPSSSDTTSRWSLPRSAPRWRPSCSRAARSSAARASRPGRRGRPGGSGAAEVDRRAERWSPGPIARLSAPGSVRPAQAIVISSSR